MDEGKVAAAQIQLKGVEVHESSLVRQVPGFAVNNFNFNINVQNKIDANQKLIFIECKVTITGDDKNSILGSVSTACVFTVLNFEEVVKQTDDTNYDMHDSLTKTLNAIALSTTRGIMFSQFKGTFLHFALLPVLDLQAFNKAKQTP